MHEIKQLKLDAIEKDIDDGYKDKHIEILNSKILNLKNRIIDYRTKYSELHIERDDILIDLNKYKNILNGTPYIGPYDDIAKLLEPLRMGTVVGPIPSTTRRPSQVSNITIQTGRTSTGDDTRDDGTRDDGTRDDGTRDDGTRDDGTRDDGTRDDGTRDDGTRDELR